MRKRRGRGGGLPEREFFAVPTRTNVLWTLGQVDLVRRLLIIFVGNVPACAGFAAGITCLRRHRTE